MEVKKFSNTTKLLKDRIIILDAEMEDIKEKKDWDNLLPRWKECHKEREECKHELDLINLLESTEASDGDLMTLVHDHRNSTDNFKWQIDKLQEWVSTTQKEHGDLKNLSIPYTCLEYLRTRRKELMDGLDVYYVKEKSKKISNSNKSNVG